METQTRKYERYAPRSAPTPAPKQEKHNQPLKKFRIGSISATVWENQGLNEKGEVTNFRNVSFERAYRDAKGEWQSTTGLRASDLPKAILVLNKAYEYLAFDNAKEEAY